MIKNGFYYAGSVIEDMLNEGYEISEICINNEVYNGNLIKNINFMNCVCIEFIYGEIMFIPYEQINYITIFELEDDDDE